MTQLWFKTALLPQGWAGRVRVRIEGGRIAGVETQVEPASGDERHAIALPGQCNVHSHGFQRGMAGLTEQRGRPHDDFWSWRELMYRFLDRLDPEDIAAITAQAYVEMLETGYTRVGEFHYLHNAANGQRYDAPEATAAAIVEAARQTGIGLTLLPVFYAHADFGGTPPAPGQRRFISNLDGFARLVDASEKLLDGDDRIGIAPHSLRAVTPDELKQLLTLRPAAPVHIHAAEQTKEVEASIAHLRARPVEWLLGNAGVDARWCLVHSIHLTEVETDALAASDAAAGLCPVTEANLGDGIFPARRYLDAGGRFATGTDSNIQIDIAAELRQLEYSQRLRDRARGCLATPEEPSVGGRLFRAAGTGGAQALQGEFGIVVGHSADIVSLDADHSSLIERNGDALIDGWIFGSNRPAVDCVWRGGKPVVRDGAHLARAEVATRYRKTLAKLLA
ncbi:formimidoylglutamate deiminase [Sphingomonas sp. MAH-20]|uniref:Formimidoylglutamate deiminase n=1 Tax=Sphingomonas horti TaxID=2682842 RepID=A0A6I4J7W2_9SPHN|nr:MULTISPECIES: formimidoylglutamate deiminase [Sphingomonas]MBA2918898.1 formimidoylglutamate deiminase [Sphingomonas sp. CGMCC 1.13658]MVO78931.1 formimidoylglutamate deiminase [Sphingomonas horti]